MERLVTESALEKAISVIKKRVQSTHVKSADIANQINWSKHYLYEGSLDQGYDLHDLDWDGKTIVWNCFHLQQPEDNSIICDGAYISWDAPFEIKVPFDFDPRCKYLIRQDSYAIEFFYYDENYNKCVIAGVFDTVNTYDGIWMKCDAPGSDIVSVHNLTLAGGCGAEDSAYLDIHTVLYNYIRDQYETSNGEFISCEITILDPAISYYNHVVFPHGASNYSLSETIKLSEIVWSQTGSGWGFSINGRAPLCDKFPIGDGFPLRYTGHYYCISEDSLEEFLNKYGDATIIYQSYDTPTNKWFPILRKESWINFPTITPSSTNTHCYITGKIGQQNYFDIQNIKTKIDILKITHRELKNLRDNGKLIPGKKYRIIDYVTTTSQTNTVSAGHPFDIIVTALDEFHLSEEASALPREGDSYFSGQNLQSWKLWYCLDNDVNRFSWGGEIYSEIESTGFNKGKALYVGNLGQNYQAYMMHRENSTNGTVAADDWIGISLNGASVIEHVRNGMSEEEECTVVLNPDKLLSKGVIYRMIDEFGNDCPYDFKNIKYVFNTDTKQNISAPSNFEEFWGNLRAAGYRGTGVLKFLTDDRSVYTFTVDRQDGSIINTVRNCIIKSSLPYLNKNFIFCDNQRDIRNLVYECGSYNCKIMCGGTIHDIKFKSGVQDVTIDNGMLDTYNISIQSSNIDINETDFTCGDYPLTVAKNSKGKTKIYCETDFIL